MTNNQGGHKGLWRGNPDLVLMRAEHLPEHDRALILASIGQGRTAREIAALFGINPRSVRRRLKRLTRRVLSDRFSFVLRHRETWPASRRRIATAVIVRGTSIRNAATELNTSLYNVRKHLDAVAALLHAFAPAGPVAPHDSTPAPSSGTQLP